jgi:hypothetical protein
VALSTVPAWCESEACGHLECEQARLTAAKLCAFCREPIGRGSYYTESDGGLIHPKCWKKRKRAWEALQPGEGRNAATELARTRRVLGETWELVRWLTEEEAGYVQLRELSLADNEELSVRFASLREQIGELLKQAGKEP